MPKVQVSGHQFKWPNVCVCCLETSDKDIPIRHIRETGVRVIRETEWVEYIPYCRPCLGHVMAFREYNRLQIAPVILVYFLGAFFLFASLLSLISTNNMRREQVITGVMFSAFAFVVGGLSIIGGIYFHIKRREKRQELENKAESLLSKTCCVADDLSVEYLDRKGTLSTFLIENDQYAVLFATRNNGRVLR